MIKSQNRYESNLPQRRALLSLCISKFHPAMEKLAGSRPSRNLPLGAAAANKEMPEEPVHYITAFFLPRVAATASVFAVNPTFSSGSEQFQRNRVLPGHLLNRQ